MFERSREGVINVIRGDEPLDADHIKKFNEVLEPCLEHGQPRALVNLQNIPLIDSAGLETLLDFRESFEARGGALKLLAPNSLCMEILQLTGVAAHFEIYSEPVSALGSFAQ